MKVNMAHSREGGGGGLKVKVFKFQGHVENDSKLVYCVIKYNFTIIWFNDSKLIYLEI